MKKIALLSREEFALLHFLWRWKLSTTAAIHRKFYSDRTRHRAYVRLWKLERGGFIRSQCDETATHWTWILAERGYKALRYDLPPLVEGGFIPPHWGHDLIASAVHLGEEPFKEIPGLQSFSEQEFRSIDPKYYPSWVPQYQTRRPDGYWQVTQNGASRVVALEVETTRKRKNDYETIARQYDTDGVDMILWVVSRISLAKTIYSRVEYVDRKAFKHNYVLLDAFYEKGWDATVFLGKESGKSIRELLGNFPKTDRNLVVGEFLLDTRKMADISKPPQIYRHPQVC